MRGYKVFEPDWTCRRFQYEVGKVFEENVAPKCCSSGFHFCIKASDCFRYYPFDSTYKIAEVEALGDIDVEKDGSKCCTNKIYIIRELTWHEVLDLVNSGKDCTGFDNSGNYNEGDYNSGNYNKGNYNSGNRNNGFGNSGSWNAGSWNTGACNTGDGNTGAFNSGRYNSGDHNSGYWNTGSYNTGDYNTGNHNDGNWNVGDWNKASHSNGCFNTNSSKIFLFNKPSDWTFYDWIRSEAARILSTCPSRIYSWDSKDNIKTEDFYIEYLGVSDVLKAIDEQSESERQKWWNSIPSSDREVIMNLPNFDEKIFKEITGINIWG